MDTTVNGSRCAGFSGIVFVVLSLIIVTLVPPLPTLDASASAVTVYYTEHGRNFLWGNYFAMIAAVPSFVFFSYLVLQIKKSEGDDGWLWIAVLITVTFAHAVGLVDLIFFQAAAFVGSQARAGSAVHIESIKVFADLAGLGFGFFFITQAAFAFYTAWAILKTHIFAPLHAWIGFATALTSMLASLGAVMTDGFWTIGGPVTAVGFIIFFIWILGMSAAFLRSK